MSLKVSAPPPFESDGAKRFTLRMDSKLFDSISSYAKAHRRSVAKEIECAIEQYLFNLREQEDLNHDANTPCR